MADTELATVLPKELRLGVPPKMPQARSYLFRQQSTISSYTSGQTIQINIPRLQRSYLRKDSYLRFKVTGAQTGSNNTWLCLDTCGAWGFFEKIEVFDYLGSTVLESISGVPQLMSLLLDLGLRDIIADTTGAPACGLTGPYSSNRLDVGVAPANNTQPGAFNNTYNNLILKQTSTLMQPTTGLVLINGNNPQDNSRKTFCREFAISLPSFLGLLSQKMIPLHNGFTIVLTLANQNVPFISTLPPSDTRFTTNMDKTTQTVTNALGTAQTEQKISWIVQDVNMECQILELGPVAESMIMSSTQGQPLIVHTKALRNYVSTVRGGIWSTTAVNPATVPTATNGQSEFVLNLNLNVASLTNILWMMRPSDQLDKIQYSHAGQRTRNFLQRWAFQYGSTTLPQNNGIEAMGSSLPVFPKNPDTGAVIPISNLDTYRYLSAGFTECYNELMKARSFYAPGNRIEYDSYAWDKKWNQSLDFTTDLAVNGAPSGQCIFELNMFGLFNGIESPFQMGRFACGLNLELANNKEGTIISGLNTNGMNTAIRGYFHPSYLKHMDSVRVDAYAEYDAFINVSPGIATTVSF